MGNLSRWLRRLLRWPLPRRRTRLGMKGRELRALRNSFQPNRPQQFSRAARTRQSLRRRSRLTITRPSPHPRPAADWADSAAAWGEAVWAALLVAHGPIRGRELRTVPTVQRRPAGGRAVRPGRPAPVQRPLLQVSRPMCSAISIGAQRAKNAKLVAKQLPLRRSTSIRSSPLTIGASSRSNSSCPRSRQSIACSSTPTATAASARRRTCGLCVRLPSKGRSRQNPPDHLAVHVGQPPLNAVVVIRQSRVVDAE